MFKTLRSRLLFGIAPLLAIMVALGLWAEIMFSRLGGNIDVILRENYRSVLAAQNMKEALERMDSAALFAIGGRDDRARRQYDESRPVFERNLEIVPRSAYGRTRLADGDRIEIVHFIGGG